MLSKNTHASLRNQLQKHTVVILSRLFSFVWVLLPFVTHISVVEATSVGRSTASSPGQSDGMGGQWTQKEESCLHSLKVRDDLQFLCDLVTSPVLTALSQLTTGKCSD